jgi:hypothetical protein
VSAVSQFKTADGTAYVWTSVTDPRGGCDSVDVAVLSTSFARARELVGKAGFRVSGRKPTETVRYRLGPPELYDNPDIVYWRGGDEAGGDLDPPWRRA